jgi:peptidoglycan/xylan/chitin deacetylase (PgdA/CDA1 family)
MTIKRSLYFSVFMTIAMISSSATSAVILQYHHIGDETPRITTASVQEFTAHLDWLAENDFEVIALDELIHRRQNNTLSKTEKVASISFDDTSKTICDTAWPILHQRQLPFIIFINTEIMQGDNDTQCSWQELQAMEKTGLLTVGNHSHRHQHMTDQSSFGSYQQWLNAMREEVTVAEKILDEKLVSFKKIFAYPYGESNERLEYVVEQLEYVGVGQQSGAIGNSTALTNFPRFALSGRYADIEKLADKLLSLAMPLREQYFEASNHDQQGPKLTLELEEGFNKQVQCYLGTGEPIVTQQENGRVIVSTSKKIQSGRNRYNCTAASDLPGRFYWYSYQWVQE